MFPSVFELSFDDCVQLMSVSADLIPVFSQCICTMRFWPPCSLSFPDPSHEHSHPSAPCNPRPHFLPPPPPSLCNHSEGVLRLSQTSWSCETIPGGERKVKFLLLWNFDLFPFFFISSCTGFNNHCSKLTPPGSVVLLRRLQPLSAVELSDGKTQAV